MKMLYHGVKTLDELNAIKAAKNKKKENKKKEKRQLEEADQQRELLVTSPSNLVVLDPFFDLLSNNPLQIILGFNSRMP